MRPGYSYYGGALSLLSLRGDDASASSLRGTSKLLCLMVIAMRMATVPFPGSFEYGIQVVAGRPAQFAFGLAAISIDGYGITRAAWATFNFEVTATDPFGSINNLLNRIPLP